MTISVDWDKYLDQSIDLVNMARKVTFLEADKVQLATENNKLKRELYDKKEGYEQLCKDYRELMTDYNAIKRLFERNVEELAYVRRKLNMTEKWIKGMKKKDGVNDGRA